MHCMRTPLVTLPYSAPTPPLSYTSLDHRQPTPPLPVKTEFKQEFKTEYPTYSQYNQYQAYQRLPYQPYPYYDPGLQPPSSVQYSAYPAPAPGLSSLVPLDPGSQVTTGRWPPVSSGAAGSYQVRIISHYSPPPANTILRKLTLTLSCSPPI